MRRRGFLAAILLSGPLYACAIADEMVLSDGSRGRNISCDGFELSMGDCLQKGG